MMALRPCHAGAEHTAVLESDIALDLATIPLGLVATLQQALSVPNPAYASAVKRGARTYGISPTLCGVTVVGSSVRIPRGALNQLRAAAAEHGVRLTFDDRRVLPTERLESVCSLTLRYYQELAVDALCKRQQGVLVFPCGAGKTRAAMGVISRLCMPTLILVSSADLAAQWLNELQTIGVEAGFVGGGEREVMPVTVALVQSLVRMDEAELDALLARFGLLIIDEAHHVPSDTFVKIVDRCPAKYRLALTATPHREDGLGPMLGWYCGEVIARVTHAELIACGALIAAEIRTIETSFTYDYRGPEDYKPMLDALADDPARNKLIVDTVASEAVAGHTILVLTGRIGHCESLASALQARGIVAEALTSKVKKKRRTEILQSGREGNTQVLIATSLADEGLDIPRLSRVVLAFPARAKGRTEQRLGRIMRPHPDKRDAALIDIVDVRVGVLRHQHVRRAAAFRDVLGSGGA